PLWYACPFFALFPAAAPHSLDASAKSLASAESPACSCRKACFPREPSLRIWRPASSAAQAAQPSRPPSVLFLLPSWWSSFFMGTRLAERGFRTSEWRIRIVRVIRLSQILTLSVLLQHFQVGPILVTKGAGQFRECPDCYILRIMREAFMLFVSEQVAVDAFSSRLELLNQ